jgi:hypothetical protein
MVHCMAPCWKFGPKHKSDHPPAAETIMLAERLWRRPRVIAFVCCADEPSWCKVARLGG